MPASTPDLYPIVERAWMATAIALRPSLPREEAWRAQLLLNLLESQGKKSAGKTRNKALKSGVAAFFGQTTKFAPLELIFLHNLARQLTPDAPPPSPANAPERLSALLAAWPS